MIWQKKKWMRLPNLGKNDEIFLIICSLYILTVEYLSINEIEITSSSSSPSSSSLLLLLLLLSSLLLTCLFWFLLLKIKISIVTSGDPKASLAFFARDAINLCLSVAVSTTNRSRQLAAHFRISFVPIRYIFLLFKEVLIFARQLKIRFWLTTLEQGLCCTSCHL